MTDRRAIKTVRKYDRDRLSRPEVEQEYVHKFVSRVEESDKNNINWQTLHKTITEIADEVIGKIERTERNEWRKEATENKNEAY
jgi:hypothetical protein